MVKHFLTSLLAVALISASASPALAHFNIILPADYGTWSASKHDSVPYCFIWGHGFEHVWFDAAKPVELFALSPTGGKVDLLPALKPIKVRGQDGKDYAAYSFNVDCPDRGDYIVAMKAALVWDEGEQVFLQDYAKSFLHVQDKLGWHRPAGLKFELIPLTRPYGLQPGGVFQGQVLYDGKPLPDCDVEFEKFQPDIPSGNQLPSEDFITFEARTDPNGIVTFGLHEIGWFALTATRESGQEMTQEGHKGNLVERSTLWVNIAPLTVVKW